MCPPPKKKKIEVWGHPEALCSGYFLLAVTSRPFHSPPQLPRLHPLDEGGAVRATHHTEIQHHTARRLGGSLQQQGHAGEWTGWGQS